MSSNRLPWPVTASPVLLVVSAPSGAGKTTLCERLRAEFPEIVYSVSCTTRPPRPGERDGVDYHFLEEADFRRLQREDAFLESARVHGHWYGTLRAPILEALRQGRDVLMDIDVQGAAQIRRRIHDAASDDPLRRAYVDVFIEPPSLDVLRERLLRRGHDAPEVIEARVRRAAAELEHRADYRYSIVNDILDCAYECLRSIYVAEHCRLDR